MYIFKNYKQNIDIEIISAYLINHNFILENMKIPQKNTKIKIVVFIVIYFKMFRRIDFK